MKVKTRSGFYKNDKNDFLFYIHFIFISNLFVTLSFFTLEARHSAVLRRQVVLEVVLGEVHRHPLVSPAPLVLVSVGVTLLVQVIVLGGLKTNPILHWRKSCEKMYYEPSVFKEL